MVRYAAARPYLFAGNGRRLAIVIIGGSARSLQNQFMRGAPKEKPKRRRMLAFTKVGDLLSKPSKAPEGDRWP